jgi:DNA-binding GntR family transcriptional regulator
LSHVAPQSSTRARTKSAPRPSSNGAGRPSAHEPLDNVTRVYRELRALIVSGQLPAGSRIAERAVVTRMGLSRTPVRSALHRLQQEGFVDSVGRAGDQRLIVTPLTKDDGHEIFLIIGHLEGLAARQAASLPRRERMALALRLREINRTLSAGARDASSSARLFELDEQFHRTFVDGVVGPRLLALHRAIKPQTERYARLYVDILLDELPTSVKEHGFIADAIAEGKADAAQAAVERNWHNAAERLARVIAEHGERGIWHLWHHDLPADSVPRAGRRR